MTKKKLNIFCIIAILITISIVFGYRLWITDKLPFELSFLPKSKSSTSLQTTETPIVTVAPTIIKTSTPTPEPEISTANLGIKKDDFLLIVNGLLQLNKYEILGEPFKNKAGGLTYLRSNGSAYVIKTDAYDYITEASFHSSLEVTLDKELTGEELDCILNLLNAVFDYGGEEKQPELKRLVDSMIEAEDDDEALSFSDEAIINNVICIYEDISFTGQTLTIKINPAIMQAETEATTITPESALVTMQGLFKDIADIEYIQSHL